MIAVIDYKMGNLRSISNAFNSLGEKVVVTGKPEILADADAIIIPGVGAFRDGMKNLKELGFIDVLRKEVIENKKPFLGICLGMQLIAKTSFENGEYQGLGWIDFDVIKINSKNVRIPHMGWNNLELINKGGTLFKGVNDPAVVYFVHSYYLKPNSEEARGYLTSTCQHGEKIAASIEKENIFGFQFHPEKSQNTGLTILKNFINLSKKRNDKE